MSEQGFAVGQCVRIKATAGDNFLASINTLRDARAVGAIVSQATFDPRYPFEWVVEFADGTAFGFAADELEPVEPAPAAPAPSVEGDAVAAIRERLAKMRAENAYSADVFGDYQSPPFDVQMLADFDTLLAENAALEAALKPFASTYGAYLRATNGTSSFEAWWNGANDWGSVQLACKVAAAALADAGAQEAGLKR